MNFSKDETSFAHSQIGSYSYVPPNPTGRLLKDNRESWTLALYISHAGVVPFRPRFICQSFPRSKEKKVSEYDVPFKTIKNNALISGIFRVQGKFNKNIFFSKYFYINKKLFR